MPVHICEAVQHSICAYPMHTILALHRAHVAGNAEQQQCLVAQLCLSIQQVGLAIKNNPPTRRSTWLPAQKGSLLTWNTSMPPENIATLPITTSTSLLMYGLLLRI